MKLIPVAFVSRAAADVNPVPPLLGPSSLLFLKPGFNTYSSAGADPEGFLGVGTPPPPASASGNIFFN